MNTPNQTHSPSARSAIVAATVALILGTASAAAQSSSSTGSTSNPSGTGTPRSEGNYGSGAQGRPSSSTSSATVSEPHRDSAGAGAPRSDGSYGSGGTGSAKHSGAHPEVAPASASGYPSGTAGAMTGRDTSSTRLSWTDRRFVSKAADDGMAEVQVAELAVQRATNPEVKRFAQKIVDDHSKVNSELMTLAGQKNLKLDTDDDHDRVYKRLNKKSGMEFDQEFVEHMIDEHENDVKLFQKASESAKDTDVRAFAAKHLGHLQMHLQTAQGLKQSLVPTGRMENHSGRSTTESDSKTSTTSSSSTTP